MRRRLAVLLCQVAEAIDPEHVHKVPPAAPAHRYASPGEREEALTAVVAAIRYSHPKLLAPERVAATAVVALESAGLVLQDAER